MQEDFEPIDEVSQWDKPLPFPMVEIPSFPVDSLPTPMRDFVVALAESTQTPPEMAGILSLGVLSAALQRKYVVQVMAIYKSSMTVRIHPVGKAVRL